MSRKDERKREVEAIREHARKAAREGAPRSAMPREHRGNMDERQWLDAYNWELEYLVARQQAEIADDFHTQIESIHDLTTLKACLLRLLEAIEERSE